ncbi:unnamed protein product [Amoebophrya sp. A25]|nr:unnamed protein product [Amoebophrya sp. A25]|eukprot:GSA25T00012289001.1
MKAHKMVVAGSALPVDPFGLVQAKPYGCCGCLKFRPLVYVTLIVCFGMRLLTFLLYTVGFAARERPEVSVEVYMSKNLWAAWSVFGFVVLTPAFFGLKYDADMPLWTAYYFQVATFWFGLFTGVLSVFPITVPQDDREKSLIGDMILGGHGVDMPSFNFVLGASNMPASQMTSSVGDPVAAVTKWLEDAAMNVMNMGVQTIFSPFRVTFGPDQRALEFLTLTIILLPHLYAAYVIRCAARQLQLGFFREFWLYKKQIPERRGVHAPSSDPLLRAHGPHPWQNGEQPLPQKQAEAIRALPAQYPLERTIENIRMHERAGVSLLKKEYLLEEDGGGGGGDAEDRMRPEDIWLRHCIQEHSTTGRGPPPAM